MLLKWYFDFHIWQHEAWNIHNINIYWNIYKRCGGLNGLQVYVVRYKITHRDLPTIIFRFQFLFITCFNLTFENIHRYLDLLATVAVTCFFVKSQRVESADMETSYYTDLRPLTSALAVVWALTVIHTQCSGSAAAVCGGFESQHKFSGYAYHFLCFSILLELWLQKCLKSCNVNRHNYMSEPFPTLTPF